MIYKVFVSVPMHGISDDMVKLKKNTAIYNFKFDLIKAGVINEDDDLKLIDTIHHEGAPENASRLWYLGSSIQKLADADFVLFYEDWVKARGCWVEYLASKLYGKHVTFDCDTKQVSRDITNFAGFPLLLINEKRKDVKMNETSKMD